MQLKLSLLGSFSASLEGKPVRAFESDKVRALLAYLATEADGPHSREALTTLFWPEKPEATARHNLSQAVYNLRHALGQRKGDASELLTTVETVQFCPKDGAWLDVAEFTRLVESSEQHNHHPHVACVECTNKLEQATALYRGEFLADLSLKGSLAFEEWALVRREQLRLQMQQALGRLTRNCDQLGEHEQALSAAWRLVEMDPLWEEGVRQLMALLARQGQRSAALAQYDRLQQALKHELGVEPEQATQSLADRLRGEGARRTPLGNLPAFLTPFVGRQDRLAGLREHLIDPTCRLVTVLGPGGSGKTRLAIETARSLQDEFTDGVYLVELNPLQSTESLPAALAEALGYPLQTDAAIQTQLLNYLRSKKVLLLMDGYESLTEGVGFAIDILHHAPGCKILATSRTRLGVKAENIYPLEGLDCPPAGEESQATRYSAVQLFLEAAHRANPSVDANSIDLDAVIEICRLTEGMPLGVLLASAWMSIYSPQEIASEIRKSLDFLFAEWSDTPLRQRSLRASFEYSWGLLSANEQRILAGLSVFHSGFTRQAASQVAGSAPHALLALADKCLIQRSLEGRYQLHELVRQFAAEKLRQETGAEAQVRTRHCAYFAQALQHWEDDLKSARQRAALLEMDADHENCRAAWGYAAENCKIDCLEQSLEGLCLYYDLRARLAEGDSACRQAVACLAEAGDLRVRSCLRSRTLTWQARFQRQLINLLTAETQLTESLRLADQAVAAGLDARREQAFAQLERGNLAITHDPHAAGKHYRLSLGLYRELGMEWEIAQVLTRMGWHAEKNSQFAAGMETCAEAVAILQRLGEPRTLASALDAWGFMQIRSGNLVEGERLVRQAVSVLQQTGDRAGTAYALERLGTILLWLGRFGESHALLTDSLALYRELGNRGRQPFVVGGLAISEVLSGDYANGQVTARESLALVREVDWQEGVAYALLTLSWAAEGQADDAQAYAYQEEARAVCRAINAREQLGYALAHQAISLRRLGRGGEARERLQEAFRIGLEIHAVMTISWALQAAALLCLDQGQVERALELYILGTRHPLLAASRLVEDIAGREVEAAAARLPAEVREAARRRGRERDLFATAAELFEELSASQANPEADPRSSP